MASSWRRVLPGALAVSLALHLALLATPFGLTGARAFLHGNRPLTVEIREGFEPGPAAAHSALSPTPQSAPAKVRPDESPAGVPAVIYFKASELTEPPRALDEPPLELLQPFLSGTGSARMRLFIDEAGHVNAIDVEATTLPAEVAWRAAAIFSNVRFSPGRIGALEVKSQVAITVGAADRRSYAR